MTVQEVAKEIEVRFPSSVVEIFDSPYSGGFVSILYDGELYALGYNLKGLCSVEVVTNENSFLRGSLNAYPGFRAALEELYKMIES